MIDSEDVSNIPPHVPKSLLFDFDLHHDPRLDVDLHRGYFSLHCDAPEMFYTPRNGGHWVITRFEHVRQVMLSPEIFSSHATPVPMPPPELSVAFPPLDMDDPDHRKYRALLNKFLAASAVKPLEPTARKMAIELIAEFADNGSVEYVEQFATRLPVGLWMSMMGMDLSRRREFIRWVHIVIGPYSDQERAQVMADLAAYFDALVAERERNPGDDPVSFLLQSEVDGRKLSRQMVLDICNLLFTAGLDTVTNALTFITRHLAENVDQQKLLRADPALIPRAIEELMRRFALVNTGRLVTHDTELGGVVLKKGDQILACLGAANLDPKQWPDPLKVDFGRDARGHLAFNTGPHNCAGVHLARMELKVCLEEWLKRIPEFRTAPGYVPIVRKGQTMGLENLDLVW